MRQKQRLFFKIMFSAVKAVSSSQWPWLYGLISWLTRLPYKAQKLRAHTFSSSQDASPASSSPWTFGRSWKAKRKVGVREQSLFSFAVSSSDGGLSRKSWCITLRPSLQAFFPGSCEFFAPHSVPNKPEQ